MKQKLIRDIPDGAMDAIEQKARAAEMNPEEWVRNLLIRVASEPLVKERYAIRFMDEEGPARGTIRRRKDDDVGSGFNGLDEKQAKAVEVAEQLMRRNGPGDREHSFEILGKHFDIVNEIPL